MKYEIIEYKKHGKKGNVKILGYYIRFEVSFLFIKYYKKITHTSYTIYGANKYITYFDSEIEAEDFIKTILCPNKIYNDWSEKTVKEITCK